MVLCFVNKIQVCTKRETGAHSTISIKNKKEMRLFFGLV
ncbi:hypothetical protein M23134_07667 [Microscilla marina ATCC 23134]|uniref:Uncharacterized protein n=1 Tax=Microscilla marina ATCC 23134 TaxID=313606 RepID=A1ZUV1_MICM2|nr:hypothetical protein M23134_07667 [Microscilla marina ATCC 23134]